MNLKKWVGLTWEGFEEVKGRAGGRDGVSCTALSTTHQLSWVHILIVLVNVHIVPVVLICRDNKDVRM